MAIERLRIKFTYKQGSFQASELYYSQPVDITNDSSARQMSKMIETLISLRTKLMFRNQEVRSVTITQDSGARMSWILFPGGNAWPTRNVAIINIPRTGTIAITTSIRPEQLRVAVAMKIRFASGTRSSTRFLASVPDDVTNYDDQSVNFDKVPAWWTSFNAFAAELVKNWFIKGKDNFGDGTKVDVSQLVIQATAPSNVGIQVPTGTAPSAWAKGTRLDLAHFKMVQCPCPTINGSWRVASFSDTVETGFRTFFLEHSAGVDITKVKILGTAQAHVSDYFTIDDVRITTATTHHRGNGSTQRGKRKSRCCAV